MNFIKEYFKAWLVMLFILAKAIGSVAILIAILAPPTFLFSWLSQYINPFILWTILVALTLPAILVLLDRADERYPKKYYED